MRPAKKLSTKGGKCVNNSTKKRLKTVSGFKKVIHSVHKGQIFALRVPRETKIRTIYLAVCSTLNIIFGKNWIGAKKFFG